ncbi:MAG: hypothetical protein K2V38_13785 [Gemmataceae bacterium]|nr:hypothetical protein [Gemmataceae bacterium]
MSLGVSIGRLARFVEDGDYPEGVEEFERHMSEINRLLAEKKLPTHDEPRTMPEVRSRSALDHMGYSMFARLQRAVAFSRNPQKKFTPLRANTDPSCNAVVIAEQRRGGSHIIGSSVEGYLVPVDFPTPLPSNALPGRAVGSCQSALRELVVVAPLLNIALEGDQLPDAVAEEINNDDTSKLADERTAWLILFEAFRLGIEHKTAVCFH